MIKFKELLLLILLAFLITNCDREITRPINSSEEALIGIWQYESVMVNGIAITEWSPVFENPVNMGNPTRELIDITRRQVVYDRNRNYKLQWDEGSQYSMGEGFNWQPDSGYWKIFEDLTLTHNKSQSYEVEYNIDELTETRFERSSNRIMFSTFDSTSWLPGDTVLFVEIFVKE